MGSEWVRWSLSPVAAAGGLSATGGDPDASQESAGLSHGEGAKGALGLMGALGSRVGGKKTALLGVYWPSPHGGGWPMAPASARCIGKTLAFLLVEP